MERLPILIPIAFFLTTLLALLLLYRATRFNHRLLLIVTTWLIVQAALTIAGFYLRTSGTPPRFASLVFPPMLVILVLLVTKVGGRFLDTADTSKLTLFHMVRVPVEFILFGLYLHHTLPRLMTFEGGNPDIVSGLSAPLIWYFGYQRKVIGRGTLIAWNIVCLVLLFNIVFRAILSTPFAFQRFGREQPNIALLYFPYSWLPAFVVPAVLLAHLTTLRKLIFNK